METGSTTAWTAYNAAARTIMPRPSMRYSQCHCQTETSPSHLSLLSSIHCVEFSRRLSRTKHGHYSRCRSSSYTYVHSSTIYYYTITNYTIYLYWFYIFKLMFAIVPKNVFLLQKSILKSILLFCLF